MEYRAQDEISQTGRETRARPGDDLAKNTSQGFHNVAISMDMLSGCTNPTISKDDVQEQDVKEAKLLQSAMRAPGSRRSKQSSNGGINTAVMSRTEYQQPQQQARMHQAQMQRQQQQQTRLRLQQEQMQQYGVEGAERSSRSIYEALDAPYPNPRPAVIASGDSDMRDNIARLDYEMQLMLLEQQNKKRLLRATQPRDFVFQSASAEVSVWDTTTARNGADERQSQQRSDLVTLRSLYPDIPDSQLRRWPWPGARSPYQRGTQWSKGGTVEYRDSQEQDIREEIKTPAQAPDQAKGHPEQMGADTVLGYPQARRRLDNSSGTGSLGRRFHANGPDDDSPGSTVAGLDIRILHKSSSKASSTDELRDPGRLLSSGSSARSTASRDRTAYARAQRRTGTEKIL